MNCLPRCYVLILSAFTLAMPSWGNVQMPRVFSNSMILQRGVAAPVWGWAEAGEKVTVHFAGQQKEATADANGKWSLKLEPLEANSPEAMAGPAFVKHKENRSPSPTPAWR